MRKLASVKRISDIHPIDGRDRIVLANVDGWSVIVKKDEFDIGDLCVYIEIDSVLPPKPEFEFLKKSNYRIKTMKMAGVISQGICFPLSILPAKTCRDYEIDEDVTDILCIKQYEATMDKEPDNKNLNGVNKRYPQFLMRWKWFRKLVLRSKKELSEFPSFISKTDETRIQNMPFILADKTPWVATEKIDGQSGTFCLVRHKRKLSFLQDKFEYIVCSRNRRLYQPDSSSYWNVSSKYNIELILKQLIGKFDWIAIQGECISPKVQGNKYKVSAPDLYVFNIITPEGRLDSVSASDICKRHGLKFVPIITTEYTLPDSIDEVLSYVHGQSAIGDTLREGIVFRSQDGMRSFKAVDPLFLIKYDE